MKLFAPLNVQKLDNQEYGIYVILTYFHKHKNLM
jgi:hypothetical protein